MNTARSGNEQESLDYYEACLGPILQSEPLIAFHAHFAFENIEVIGKGGMGEVFKIRDQRLGRLAALKLMQPSASQNPKTRQRFLREAKITAQLDHPAIPPVYEAGQTTKGQLYLLMRLIRGQTLREFIATCDKEKTLKEKRVELLQVLLRVAEAIAYAHKKDILHRDLKPENIMVGDFGEVLVMDWGLAKNLKLKEADSELLSRKELSAEAISMLGEVGLTVAGSIVGTPGYMPPEQLEGARIDGRADVFALGLLLSECLTGQRALIGDSNVEILAKTASGAATLPRELDSSVPRVLNWIVKEAVIPDYRYRTKSAQLFARQLNSYLSGEDVEGYSYSLYERAMTGIKKRPGLLVGTAALALMFAFSLSLWLSLEREKERSERVSLEGQLSLMNETEKREQAETKASQANKKADQAEAILAYFNEARALQSRGAPKQLIVDKVTAALDKSLRSKQALMEAAKIFEEARFLDESKTLLLEVSARFSPAYEALFALHRLDSKVNGGDEFRSTKYFLEIIEEAKKRSDENEFILVVQAQQLVEENRLKEALEIYNKIERYTTKFALAYFNRSVVYSKLKREDLAFADLKRAIELNSRYADAIYNRGGHYLRKKRWSDALNDFNKVIEISPRYYRAHYNRGIVLVRRGLLVDALSSFERTIALNPNFFLGHYNRGFVLSELGRYDEALKSYNLAYQLNSQSGNLYDARGVAYYRMGRYEDGLRDLNKALSLNPKSARSYQNRAKLLQSQGVFRKALDDYDRCLELAPPTAAVLVEKGNVYAKLKQFAEALKSFGAALEINPRSFDAHRNKGVVLEAQGRALEGLECYNKALAINPKDGQAYLYRAKYYSKRRQYKLALKDYEQSIKFNPDNFVIYNARGIDLFRLGRPKEALADLNKAVALSPKEAITYLNRGVIHRNEGRFQAALNDFNKAISLN
ncbi:MAG: tetratricopeptide repeat protein, partial [Planctomycetota bacterium]|nr:tetratricopeptide repeat protein [Planctomycetota bacterium]